MPKAIKAHSTSKGKQPAVPAPHKGCSRYSRQSHSTGVEIQSSIEESTSASTILCPLQQLLAMPRPLCPMGYLQQQFKHLVHFYLFSSLLIYSRKSTSRSYRP